MALSSSSSIRGTLLIEASEDGKLWVPVLKTNNMVVRTGFKVLADTFTVQQAVDSSARYIVLGEGGVHSDFNTLAMKRPFYLIDIQSVQYFGDAHTRLTACLAIPSMPLRMVRETGLVAADSSTLFARAFHRGFLVPSVYPIRFTWDIEFDFPPE